MLVAIKNKLRGFDRFRRQKMQLAESLLYRLVKNDSRLTTKLLPNEQVKRVLVIRQNKRIGNILFLITFVRQVRLAYPKAQVDLLLIQPWQGQFLSGLGIDHIYYSHFSWGGIVTWLKKIKTLNKANYDLLIASHCCASDALTAAMIASKNKVSRYNPQRALAFPHALPYQVSREHAAHSCLSVLQSLGHQLRLPLNHNLAFSEAEIQQGRALSRQYLSMDNSLNVAFFRGARGAKLLSATTWERLLSKFEQGIALKINWIEILSPDIKKPLRANVATFATSDMRLLGAFLKNMDAFICCDTGPLHLADASGVNCIGLYTHTQIKNFGLLGENSQHITDLDNFDVNEIVGKLGVVMSRGKH